MADTVSDAFQGLFQVKMNYLRLDTQEVGYAQNKKNTTTLYTFGDGDNANEAEVVYADTRTIPANSIDSIDLLNLTQNTLSVPVPFAFNRVRILRIVNKATADAAYLYFGASETNPTQVFAMAVGEQSEALLINSRDSYEVTSANSILRTYNPNNFSVDYEIYVVGSQA